MPFTYISSTLRHYNRIEIQIRNTAKYAADGNDSKHFQYGLRIEMELWYARRKISRDWVSTTGFVDEIKLLIWSCRNFTLRFKCINLIVKNLFYAWKLAKKILTAINLLSAPYCLRNDFKFLNNICKAKNNKAFRRISL